MLTSILGQGHSRAHLRIQRALSQPRPVRLVGRGHCAWRPRTPALRSHPAGNGEAAAEGERLPAVTSLPGNQAPATTILPEQDSPSPQGPTPTAPSVVASGGSVPPVPTSAGAEPPATAAPGSTAAEEASKRSAPAPAPPEAAPPGVKASEAASAGTAALGAAPSGATASGAAPLGAAAGAPASASAPASGPAPAAAAAPADADDGFARVWKPPPGEPPLWWVEKFEARRKAEARRQAEDPAFVTTLERVSGGEGGGRGGNPALAFLGAALQVAQLLLVLSLLLLLPAALHDGGLSLAKPFTTFAAYLAFFGLGSVTRMLRHGQLAPRRADKQVATWGGRLAFTGFVTALPLLHWACMYRYVGLSLYTNAIPSVTTLYDVIGGVGMLVAIVLNALAARELGAAYDRVTAPAALVTSGPYKLVQHPVYASYMLLFFSYGMWLHSAPSALAMLLVCVLYYRGRTALEARVLEEAFGSYYRDYAARTKKFLPFLL